MNSVRRDQELPPCQREPAPAGSKTDTLPSKYNPLSSTEGASVITDLKHGKKTCTAAVRKRSEKKVRETSIVDTKVGEGRGGGGRGVRVKIHLQPVEKTMVKQVDSQKPMEDHIGAHIHSTAPGRPQAGAGLL